LFLNTVLFSLVSILQSKFCQVFVVHLIVDAMLQFQILS